MTAKITLTAYCEEMWRFARLAKTYVDICEALGGERYAPPSLIGLHDHKGQLTAIYTAVPPPILRAAVQRSWPDAIGRHVVRRSADHYIVWSEWSADSADDCTVFRETTSGRRFQRLLAAEVGL